MNPSMSPGPGKQPAARVLTEREIYYKSLEPAQPAVFVVGPPLSGKSVVSGILSRYEGLHNVALSHEIREFLRFELNLQPPIREAKRERYLSYLRDINEGRLIDDERFILKRVVQCLKDNPKGIILDGFPRTEGQVKLFQKLTKHWKNPPIIFSVDFDHDNLPEVTRRLEKRISDSLQVGEIRTDDRLDVITTQRIPTYVRETQPILAILKRLVGPENFKEISSEIGDRDLAQVQKDAARDVRRLADAYFKLKKSQS